MNVTFIILHYFFIASLDVLLINYMKLNLILLVSQHNTQLKLLMSTFGRLTLTLGLSSLGPK